MGLMFLRSYYTNIAENRQPVLLIWAKVFYQLLKEGSQHVKQFIYLAVP